MLVPLVLSGGSGTRLWPVSRPHHPKQLLPLLSAQTMLQQTLARLHGLAGLGAPVVVCNAQHRALVQAQVRDPPPRAILLEPAGRNTAPAVALAALHVLAEASAGDSPDDDPDDDPLLLVLPADHVIADPRALHAAIERGRGPARAGKLVTFGVVPTRAETGYGYIRAARRGPVAPIARFVEKPDPATARAYVASGEYYWNSGMFLLGARRYLEQLRMFCPAMVTACERARAGGHTEDSADGPVVHLDPAAWEACPADSIDYAVMEKTEHGVVVALDAGWSDVGSWDALHALGPHDDRGNTLGGAVIAIDCKGSLIRAEHRRVAAVGLRDMVVVETADAVLVIPRARSQEVKQIVARLPDPRSMEGTRLRQLDLEGGQTTEPEHAAWNRRLVALTGSGHLYRPDHAPERLEPGTTVWIPAGARYHLKSDDGLGLRLLAIDFPAP